MGVDDGPARLPRIEGEEGPTRLPPQRHASPPSTSRAFARRGRWGCLIPDVKRGLFLK